jgi:hypothetical protein
MLNATGMAQPKTLENPVEQRLPQNAATEIRLFKERSSSNTDQHAASARMQPFLYLLYWCRAIGHSAARLGDTLGFDQSDKEARANPVLTNSTRTRSAPSSLVPRMRPSSGCSAAIRLARESTGMREKSCRRTGPFGRQRCWREHFTQRYLIEPSRATCRYTWHCRCLWARQRIQSTQ